MNPSSVTDVKEDTIVKEGELLRRGRNIGTFKSRYFVLKQNGLEIYASPASYKSSDNAKPKLYVPIDKSFRVVQPDDDNLFTFVFDCSPKRIDVKGTKDNANAHKEWMEAVMIVQEARGVVMGEGYEGEKLKSPSSVRRAQTLLKNKLRMDDVQHMLKGVLKLLKEKFAGLKLEGELSVAASVLGGKIGFTIELQSWSEDTEKKIEDMMTDEKDSTPKYIQITSDMVDKKIKKMYALALALESMPSTSIFGGVEFKLFGTGFEIEMSFSVSSFIEGFQERIQILNEREEKKKKEQQEEEKEQQEEEKEQQEEEKEQQEEEKEQQEEEKGLAEGLSSIGKTIEVPAKE